MKPMLYVTARFPPTLDQLHHIELAAGTVIPREIRSYFIGLPGNWPSRDRLKHGEKVLSGIRIGGLWDEAELKLIRSADSICLFFGGYDGEELLGIELIGNERGSVYLCERKRGQSGRRGEKIADNLFAFLDMLEEDPRSDFYEHYKRFDDGGPEWVLQTYRQYEEYLPTDEELMRSSDPSRLIDLEVTHSGPGISEEYLDWIECAFRIRLPLDLRKFYSIHNGGRPTKRLIECDGQTVDLSFHSMERSLEGGPPAWKFGEFVEVVNMSKYRHYSYPAHMWPLGYISYPRYPASLAFSTAKGEFGSIWLITIQSEVRPVKIADSFSDFVRSVWVCP